MDLDLIYSYLQVVAIGSLWVSAFIIFAISARYRSPDMGCKCPEDNGPYCSCWMNSNIGKE